MKNYSFCVTSSQLLPCYRKMLLSTDFVKNVRSIGTVKITHNGSYKDNDCSIAI